MKIAIYARVSTDDKDQNPERQKLACENYCDLHKHEILSYHQDFCSGNTNPYERGGFKSIFLDKPEAIVIYEISRFSREHPSKVMRRLKELKDKGIKIISITEPAFNMEGEMSDLLQYIMTWFNNYYLQNLKRAVKSGLDKARKDGKTLGRPQKKVNLYEIAREFQEPKASISSVSKKLQIPRATLYRHYEKCVQKGLLKKP